MTDDPETVIENYPDQSLKSTGEALPKNDSFSREEILGWTEFCCWTVIVLIPFFYYINGPAVSTDQLVVRSTLTIVAVAGGIGLTIRRFIMRRVS